MKDIKELSKDIKNKISLALEGTGIDGVEIMQQTAPKDTGFLIGNIDYGLENLVLTYYFPFYAPYVEYGMPPHAVSPKVLEDWCKRKGINPFALANHIKKYGTRSHPFIRPFIFNKFQKVLKENIAEQFR